MASEAVADGLVKLFVPDELEADLSAAGRAHYLSVESGGKSVLPSGFWAVPVTAISGMKRAIGDPYRHFGGRDLGSPVADVTLGLAYGSLLAKFGLGADDGAETPCLTSDTLTASGKHFLNDFPYLGAPR